jgi:hypothetical protein
MSDARTLVKQSVMTFDLPFMINLPDGPYEVTIENFHATVYITRTRSPFNMAGLPQGVQFPADAYVKGDRLGRFNYSKIIIVFHHEIFIKPGIIIQDLLFLKSVEIVNTILNVCRGVRGDHYVRINDSDIFSHNLKYVSPEGEEVSGGAFAIGGQMEIGTGGAYEPTPEELSKIKAILSGNATLPLWQSILLDAYDNHFYRNYRMAIIEAGTAFEVFVYSFVRTGYLRLGKSEQDIETKLMAPFKNLLCDHIKILTGNDFCKTAQYQNWNDNSYEKRNQIVHRGTNATDVDSSTAVTIVGDTIRFLMSLNYL